MNREWMRFGTRRGLLLSLFAVTCLAASAVHAANWVRLLDGYPFSRKNYAWVYDTTRNVAVLYGGNGAAHTVYSDTWEWNGTMWRRIATATTPGPLEGHAMAYDPVRNRTVLFGGNTGAGIEQSTWEYDGVDWRRVLPAVSPAARQKHRMAFLPALGEVVLFGGVDAPGTTLLGDTWRFNGTRWLQVFPPTSPPARYKHGMTLYPSLGVVLFGGDTLLGAGGDDAGTWTFNGSTWLPVATAQSPPARDTVDIVADPVRGNVVLFGGAAPGVGAQPFGDTWVFNGANWTQVMAPVAPTPRDSLGVVFDPVQGGVLLFGGSVTEGGADVTGNEGEDFWRFNGTTWSEVLTTSPPSRSGASMAYDPDQGAVILYGGKTEAFNRDDTWKLTSVGWQRINTSLTPRGLSQASAAFFKRTATRAVMVYGGRRQDNTVSGELWRLDAGTWTTIPAGAPPGVYSSAMVFDTLTSELRFFAGNRVVPNPLPFIIDQTWEYAGSSFQELVTATRPAARYRHAMAFDDASGPARTLLFGGTTGATLASDETWVFASATSSWSQVVTAPPGSGRYNLGLAPYPPGGSVVVFGGHVPDSTRTAMTWAFNLAGMTWQPLLPAREPEPRSNFAMVWDAVRGRIVLFGGSVDSGTAGDTWLFLDDQDGDLVGDVADNCPAVANPDQADLDADTVGNACDNCWGRANPSQLDSNGDCPAPPYARDPTCGDACLACVGIANREVGGVRVRRSPADPANLEISFDASLVPLLADHVNVYRGSLAAIQARTYDHTQLPGGAACNLLTSPAVDAGAGRSGASQYYLAVPACEGLPDIEGSYGSASPPLGERPHVNEPPINGVPCP